MRDTARAIAPATKAIRQKTEEVRGEARESLRRAAAGLRAGRAIRKKERKDYNVRNRRAYPKRIYQPFVQYVTGPEYYVWGGRKFARSRMSP